MKVRNKSKVTAPNASELCESAPRTPKTHNIGLGWKLIAASCIIGGGVAVPEMLAQPVPVAEAAEPPNNPCPDGYHVQPGTWEDTNMDEIAQFSEVGCAQDAPPPPADSDGDGINDNVDSCPNQKETFNGYKDTDGCPDTNPDPDGDGIQGGNDKCPGQKETVNGYLDSDGCPDTVPATTPPTQPTNPPTSATNPGTGTPTSVETTVPDTIEVLDSDDDGVTDVVEREYGTNPNKPDTDGDGKGDKEELYKADGKTLLTGRALDTDGDGKINAVESDEDLDCDGKSPETGDNNEQAKCPTPSTDAPTTATPTTEAVVVPDQSSPDECTENCEAGAGGSSEDDNEGMGGTLLLVGGLGALVVGAGGVVFWAAKKRKKDEPKVKKQAPVRPSPSQPRPGIVNRTSTDL